MEKMPSGVEKKTMRQEQAAETRRRLLDAAKKLFAENGYDATPIRSINREIGIADGLLYYYFPGGKKEILQVLIRDNFVQLFTGLQARAKGLDDLPLAEAIEAVFLNWEKLFLEHQDIIKILFKENEIMQLVEREKLAEIAQSGERWFPELLRKRAQSGEIQEIDYCSASKLLFSVILGHFLIVLTKTGSGPLRDAEQRKKLIAYQVGLWKNQQS